MASPSVDRRFGLVGNAAVKAPVTALAFTNIALSGQQTIDGVAVLALNTSGVADRVLCVGQTDPVENGIYDVSLNAWTRSLDANGRFDLTCGSMIYVQRGTTYQRTSWHLTTNLPITIGTTALAFELGISDDLLTAAANAHASAAQAADSADDSAGSAADAAAALAAARGIVAGLIGLMKYDKFTGPGPYNVTNGTLTTLLWAFVAGQFWDADNFLAVGQLVTNTSGQIINAQSVVHVFYL